MGSTGRPYIRLLRAQDLQTIKEVHRDLFSFDIAVSDETLYDAVGSSRWLCLAAVQAQPGGGEQLAGFVMSAVGQAQDFAEGGYLGSPAPQQAGASSTGSGSTTAAASPASAKTLELLKLSPEDVCVNVCLLGVLPGFRRAGVASQLFSQVINSGRNARAKAIVLHVLVGNTPAISFYSKLGFKQAGVIPGFYQISEPGAQESGCAGSDHDSSSSEGSRAASAPGGGSVQYKDAQLLYLPLLGPEAAAQQQAAAASTSSSSAFVSTSPSYRMPARGGGSTASAGASSTGSTARPAGPPPAPKMRGLMPTSLDSSKSMRRSTAPAPAPAASPSTSSLPAAKSAAASPSSPPSAPALPSLGLPWGKQQGSGSGASTSSTSSGQAAAPWGGSASSAPSSQPSTSSQGQSKQGEPGGVLGALSGAFGGLFGGKGGSGGNAGSSQGQQQQPQQRVVVNNEQLVVVKGNDGEVHIMPEPGETQEGGGAPQAEAVATSLGAAAAADGGADAGAGGPREVRGLAARGSAGTAQVRLPGGTAWPGAGLYGGPKVVVRRLVAPLPAAAAAWRATGMAGAKAGGCCRVGSAALRPV